RPNTLAAEMEGIVPMEERRRRNEMLTILSEKKRRHFYNQFIGQTRRVLFEHGGEVGKLSGFTDNYVKIEMEGEQGLINSILPVRLTGINQSGHVEIETPALLAA
ncbi:MAG: tRNA (N(6)-L-threonylcarbamoyladenosine(37)-C(2))-methylthiotransferase MtaB, partial [Bacteroidota bacterium]